MVGFSMLELDGEWVVKEDDSGLLKPGDLVVSIGERPLRDWLDDISSLTGITDWRSMIGRLPYYLSHLLTEEQVKVEVMNQQGFRSVDLLRKPIDFEALNLGETTGKWPQSEIIAYIRIQSFNHLKIEEGALELLEEFRDDTAVIVDVRGNGGGSTPGKLTQRLMDRRYRWWKERARHPEFLRRRHPKAEICFAPDYSYAESGDDYADPVFEVTPYTGKLVLLVDRFSGSAAEDFILPFLENGRATIISERTFGSTGQPLIWNFDDGNIVVMVGAIRSFLPNGNSFEGNGIVPNLEVTMRREDLYQQRDVTLEKALEFLHS
ncbi:S41 family peptidase [Paenibacillus sp. TAF58]